MNTMNTSRLKCTIDGRIIFKDLSHSFPTGITYITGANGSGKTCLLRILSGITPPSAGAIELNSIDIYQDIINYKRRMSYVPAAPYFYPLETISTFLSFVESTKKTDAATKVSLIAAFNLKSFLGTQLKSCSLGTLKKAFIIAALMTLPDVLLLDEPSIGLDKESMQALMGYLAKYSENTIIIVATHNPRFKSELGGSTLNISKKLLTDSTS